MERVTYHGPTLGKPILLGLAGRHHNRCNRSIDRCDEAALPLALLRPWPQVPFHRLWRDAEHSEKLEVLILYVLNGTRGNLSVGKEPVQVAGAGAIESELDRSLSESSYDPRLEINLQVDHEVEASVRELRGSSGESHQAFGTIEDDYLIDRSVSADESGGAGLEYPGDTSVGIRTFERVHHRKHVHCVTDCAHHHDANPVWYSRRHE